MHNKMPGPDPARHPPFFSGDCSLNSPREVHHVNVFRRRKLDERVKIRRGAGGGEIRGAVRGVVVVASTCRDGQQPQQQTHIVCRVTARLSTPRDQQPAVVQCAGCRDARFSKPESSGFCQGLAVEHSTTAFVRAPAHQNCASLCESGCRRGGGGGSLRHAAVVGRRSEALQLV